MFEWSTDDVDAHERFDFWREVVCRTMLDVATERPGGSFSARISARRVGDICFVAYDASDHEIVRTRQHVVRAPGDCHLVSWQRRGRSLVAQDDETVALETDEIIIVDGRRPFQIVFPGSVSRVIAILPHAMIDRRAPWLSANPLRKIMAASPLADLARRHLRLLAAAEPDLGEHQTTVLTENLCNLVALASTDELSRPRLQPDLGLESLLVFCRQKLHDAELSPQVVAARFGISVRTLHLRFERLGQSFGRWLLECRLDACSKALRDPHQSQAGISDIAYCWGFNDLSHFNKAFRARYGMPPREWRMAGMTRAALQPERGSADAPAARENRASPLPAADR